VTGSKFFGGPAFSGAFLLPLARWPARCHARSTPDRQLVLGTAFAGGGTGHDRCFPALAASMAATLSDRAAAIERAICFESQFVPIGGLAAGGLGGEGCQVFSPSRCAIQLTLSDCCRCGNCDCFMSALLHMGVLLGQPVGLGSFGGLRVAIGQGPVGFGRAMVEWSARFRGAGQAISPHLGAVR